MTIDLHAPYSEYAGSLPYLTELSQRVLNEFADKEVLNKWSMTLGQLFRFCAADFSEVIPDMQHLTVAQWLWLQSFPEWLGSFCKACENLSVPQTPDMQTAAGRCLKVDWQEGLLIFARRYFGLKSFTEAEGVLVGDFLMARKDEYNNAMFERAMGDIQRKRLKR